MQITDPKRYLGYGLMLLQSTRTPFALLLLFLFSSSPSLDAQKPMPHRDLEMLVDESEPSTINANRRISDITGKTIALYYEDALQSGDTPEEMARDYLTNYRYKFGYEASDINQLRHHATRKSLSGTVVRFRQYHNDLPVNTAEVTVKLNKDNAVTMVLNGFRYDVDLDNVSPSINEDAARQIALDYLGVTEGINYEKTRLMIYNLRETSRLAYELRIEPKDPIGDWSVLVDAQTGEIFKVEDKACYYHGKKHVHPKPQPQPQPRPILPLHQQLYNLIFVADGTGNVWDNDPLSTANETYGGNYADNNDATNVDLDAELQSRTLLDLTFDGTDYSLDGPYAEIQDFENPTTGLFSQSSSTFAFDREEQGFEAVVCYYHIDQSMRYINETLNITLMPYQYATGVRFDPHGLNGNDNAHYLSGSGRVAFGEGGVDDGEDTDVVLHELGHGLRDWVTNGGLSQTDGLSEGCGDYWAASYRRSLGLWTPADDEYNWVFGWDGHNEFWNGRITDYTAAYPGGLIGSIHSNGQIWATSLMKVYDIIGRAQTDKAFLEGLGTTNGSSSQNDAAVAVYNAAIDMGYPISQVLAIHTTFTNTGYTLPAAPLPVELAAFTADKTEKGIQLDWNTVSETNNDYFSIERSDDGRTFTEIGTVKGNGTVSSEQLYQFLDEQPLVGMNYYRLQQVDFDGRSTASEIRTVMNESISDIRLYSASSEKALFVEANLLKGGNAQLSIYNANGQLMSESVLHLQEGKTKQSIAMDHLPAGVYIAQINWGTINQSTRVVLK